MANMILAFPNRIDDATLSGGSWNASLPITNIQNRKIGKVARTSGDASGNTIIIMDMGVDQFIKVVSIVNHNLSSIAEWRITGSSVSNFSVLDYDSGQIDVWGVVHPYGSLQWGLPNWWEGTLSEEETEDWIPTATHILPSTVYARYWKIQFFDTTNPDGYVQIGRIFIGDGWQPLVNMDYGSDISWNTDTGISQALSGAEYFNRTNPYRSATFKLSNLTIDEGLGNGFDLTRKAGMDKEVFFIFDPDDTIHAFRRQFLARLRKLSQIEYPYFDRTSMAFEVKELI